MTEHDLAFSLTLPTSAPELPLVVEVPHASIAVDPETLSYLIGPARSIGQDADLFVDELFANAPSLGASLLVSRRSRYVCDLNRAADDVDRQTTLAGTAPSSPHGVVWRRTTTGRAAIGEPLPTAEIDRRLTSIYYPYHEALERRLAELEGRFGYVILLCAHSMPSFGRLGERRADVVPGSQGKTTSSRRLLAAVESVCAKYRYDFAHDEPYRGGYTTRYHGRPAQGRHALQIELARRIYMDEKSLARRPAEFGRTAEFCDELVLRLGETRP